jgi:hypothetical protein
MNWPDILPSADLLRQIGGVESGLRTRRRLGTIGWIGMLIGGSLQIAVILLNNKWFENLLHAPWEEMLRSWPLVLPLLVVIFGALAFSWYKFWLKESQEPFRYSCSIGEFKPIRSESDGKQMPSWLPHEIEEKLLWLSYDLADKLSQRVGRLLFQDEKSQSKNESKGSKGTGKSEGESHIHIRGFYVIREDRFGWWTIELMPRVRIGLAGAAESLGHPVLYNLKAKGPPKTLDRKDYERILERIYFSIATEVYQQIRKDVERKIDLLPTSYFRAVALFHEAEDYARSNTLDAYREAGVLYWRAAELFDPCLKRLPESRWRRFVIRTIWRRLVRVLQWAKAVASHFWLRAARVQVFCARAEIGYANMLLYRRILAPLSGERLSPIFESRPVAESALARLKRVPSDAPSRRESLFDSYVTLALALTLLGSKARARELLKMAREHDPQRTEDHHGYLFVSAALEGHRLSRMNLYRRVTEMVPRFEVAQWRLASESEQLWRSRRTLESNVADLTLKECEKALGVNPGNVSAWANQGYIRWLLGGEDNLQKAEQDFKSGLEYKAIKPQTFVFQLDYGLARIAAERGNFAEAYEHYLAAVSSFFAEGAFHGEFEYASYYFYPISEEMLHRFTRYESKVKSEIDRLKLPHYKGVKYSVRIVNAVYSFVLNDCGLACMSFFHRSGSIECQKRARELYQQAIELNPDFVLPRFNLWSGRDAGDLESAGKHIRKVVELEPRWPDSTFAYARQLTYEAAAKKNRGSELRKEAAVAKAKAEAERVKARDVEGQAKEAKSRAEKSRKRAKQLLELGLREEADNLERVAWECELNANNFETYARGFKTNAEELEEKAPEFENAAATSEREADSLQHEVREQLQILLPHPWLWTRNEHSGRVRFDWRCLSRRSLTKELRWEREFDDLQVRALFEWARLPSEADRSWRKWLRVPLHLSFLRAVARRLRKGRNSRLVGVCELRLRRWIAQSLQKRRRSGLTDPAELRLLQSIEEHFWPDDFDLLCELREKDARRAKEYKQRLFSQIQSEIAEDPFSYACLTWAADVGAEQKEIHFYFLEAIRGGQLYAEFYEWLNRCLSTVSVNDEVLSAYDDAFDRAKKERNAQWLFNLGRGYAAQGNWSESLQAYRLAMQVDSELQEPVHEAGLYHREIGRALWALGSHEEAVAEIQEVNVLGNEAETNWRFELVREITAAGGWYEYRHRLRAWLERERHKCATNGDEISKCDVYNALLHLAHERNSEIARRRDHKGSSVDRPLDIIPIAVELGAKLCTPLEGEGDSHPLFKKYLPEVRERIQMAFRVRTPGVRVWLTETGISLNAYRILVDEVPISNSRTVNPMAKFCPYNQVLKKEFGEQLVGVELVWNPLTEKEDGAWLDPNFLDGRDELKSMVWDYFEYIARHLETVLRSNLAPFLDFQEVSDALKSWRTEVAGERSRQRTELIQQALPNLKARLTFARVLQDLVRESVPITNLQAIFEGFLPYHDIDEALVPVEALRLKLKDGLPGNNADSKFLKLTPGFEFEVKKGVHRSDGRTFFAISLKTKYEMLKVFRNAFKQHRKEQCVIVTQSDGIRPFVRRMIAVEFPTVPVLSAQELLPSLRSNVPTWIDYKP